MEKTDRFPNPASSSSILDDTLAASVPDAATETSDGRSLQRMIDGVSFREVPTHIDDRGTVFELYDTRWNWHPEVQKSNLMEISEAARRCEGLELTQGA